VAHLIEEVASSTWLVVLSKQVIATI